MIGKFLVAIFALFFVDNLELKNNDILIVPLMCVMCVGIPFVLVTIAPRFITAAEVNLFFLLETIIGQNLKPPGVMDIIFSPEIYFPLGAFFILIITTIFLRKIFYKKCHYHFIIVVQIAQAIGLEKIIK